MLGSGVLEKSFPTINGLRYILENPSYFSETAWE